MTQLVYTVHLGSIYLAIGIKRHLYGTSLCTEYDWSTLPEKKIHMADKLK